MSKVKNQTIKYCFSRDYGNFVTVNELKQEWRADYNIIFSFYDKNLSKTKSINCSSYVVFDIFILYVTYYHKVTS